ncbi:DUF4259 domain-containing protein [Rugosimonospora acidiphila]|uniref:DUF4259 domain-containing protein n=1 Tax=Rugosimonospora acidiphila TaxID=556531 RepID=UPI0031E70933
MGRWGVGNFDEDTAADHVSGIVARLVGEVERAMAGDPEELEPDEYWGVAVPCDLELLCLLAEQRIVGVQLPAADTVRSWKRAYLAVWDGSIDELDPGPEFEAGRQFEAGRRAVLVATFDRLIGLAARDQA